MRYVKETASGGRGNSAPRTPLRVFFRPLNAGGKMEALHLPPAGGEGTL